MAFANYQGNRFKIDEEIGQNHGIRVDQLGLALAYSLSDGGGWSKMKVSF